MASELQATHLNCCRLGGARLRGVTGVLFFFHLITEKPLFDLLSEEHFSREFLKRPCTF